ncbi:C40 family peptidase [uncultured Holdemanella sp.]|uniref:C40 family peptidase n=1 Tax=uncultured Holdemanella sp. TaxID=1763549 RepID=UPI0025F217AF|nr:NlpC/P60 family protein [uncultured Holdemanella sp.]
MNFVENNGKKVAAILCVASAFPVVATVVAAKEEPGWHGDRYVNEDKTVAKGWQEIEGKSYYFSEDGTVNSSKTENATTASVSSNITGEVKETVATASQEAVKQETEEKAVVEETPVQTEEVKTETTETTETTTDTTTDTTVTPDTAETPEVPAAPEQTPEQNPTPAPEAPAAPEQTPEQNPTPAPEAPATPEQNPTPAPEAPAAPEQTPSEDTTTPAPTPDQTVTPAPEETVTPAPEQTTSSLGDRISSSAQGLVGVTDGLWCTQVVQQALANAGVSDAYQLWPDQYQGVYGYYTDSPLAGDLIYYNNGGRGVDHIAIYIGNGQAIHGNYKGKTVQASAYQDGMGNPQYIRVVR